MICPSCKTPHENVRGKCPHCEADLHGSPSSKHAVAPREVVKAHSCEHRVFRHWPCSKCGRAEEDCAVYRQSLVKTMQHFYMRRGAMRSEAWDQATKWVADLDLDKPQEEVQ